MQQQFGFDDYGNEYKSINEMWQQEFDQNNSNLVKKQVGSKDNWYQKGAQYWENEPATINGNLGGFEKLHPIDIEFSQKQLQILFKGVISKERALDCGSGIGRITKELLRKEFEKVDLIDQCKKYIDEAKVQMKEYKNVENYYVEGLQTFQLQHKYSCIWIQWVIGQLTDQDFVLFLINCRSQLVPNGAIIIKDNVASQGFIVSKEDYSVCRSEPLLLQIFAAAQLKIVYQNQQTNFPKELFKVIFYVLKPI